ncbi:MAG: PAS domain-containing protein [Chloroflexi bacterium]|nr:PAS domain-containing protein [Chloroflexota bacterium]
MEPESSHLVTSSTHVPDPLATLHPSIIDSLQTGILIVDREYRVQMANKFVQDWLKRSAEEMRGQLCHRLIHVRDEICPDCPTATTFRTGETATVIHTGLDKEGGITYAEIITHPIKDDQGQVLYVMEQARDISERIQFERETRDELERRVEQRTAELARANEQLRTEIGERQRAQEERERLLAEVQRRAIELDTIVTSIPDALIIYGSKGEIIRANPAARQLLGCGPAEAELSLSQRLEVMHAETPDGKPISAGLLPWEALSGEAVQGILTIIHPSPDSTIWLSASVAPFIVPDSGVLGAVVVFTDITALRRLQEQQEEYIHTISHDLRAPLTVIQGQAQMIQRFADKLDMVRYSSEAIETGARQMNVMIQDLVDSARLEAGQLRLQRWSVGLNAFFSSLLRRATGLMDISRVQVQMPPDLPPVNADPDRLERIMLNLISNALKYSPTETEVRVNMERQAQDVVVSVIDRGVGVSPEDLPHIFERFYRSKAARSAEGLGLGLYITKMLVEAHRGRIWVKSEPGDGSAFYFTLPLA